jgi:hypothetical protein
MILTSFLLLMLILHFVFKVLKLKIDKTSQGDILLWYNSTENGERKYFFIYKKTE